MTKENGAGIRGKSIPESPDIVLGDIFGFLRDNTRTLIICVLLGLAAGVAAYIYLPNKWQADITLKIGKVLILQNLNYIEEPVEVAEKIKSPLFLSKIVSAVYGKDVTLESPVARLLYKDLKVSVMRGGGLVTVNVLGRTADEAYKTAGIIADNVIAEHRALASTYLAGTKRRLTEVTENITQNREALIKLDAIGQTSPSRNEANALLRMALIDAKSNQIRELKAEQAELEKILSAATLQETSIVGRSLPPQTPGFPNLLLLIIGGAFIGLFAGALLSFGLSARRRKMRSHVNLDYGSKNSR